MSLNSSPGFLMKILEKLFALEENTNRNLNDPKKILIVRQHNQLGDLLAGVSLFRALKETYPGCQITLIVSPFNYPGVAKNRFIDRIFVFKKFHLFNPVYFVSFWRLIKEEYDVAIVPVVVSISFTSNMIARISSSKIRIGPRSLNGKKNKTAFLFDRRIDLDWSNHPDSNVSERSLDIIRNFRVNTDNYKTEITFDENDVQRVQRFLEKSSVSEDKKKIGIHVGAGKPANRWSLVKFVFLTEKLLNDYNPFIYFTGSRFDKNEIDFIKNKLPDKVHYFINKPITEVATLISMSDLFISNDTGIMHVAGSTETPQISIFGPTNPFNWAPIGENKHFIRKSELIDDVSVEDVYSISRKILEGEKVEL